MDAMQKEVIQVSVQEEEKRMLVNTMNNERLRSDGVFFQSKKDPSLVLYPELQFIRKTRSQGVTFWGEDSNQWLLSQVPSMLSLWIMHFIFAFIFSLFRFSFRLYEMLSV